MDFSFKRRRFLGTAGAVFGVGVAGCLGDDDDGLDNGDGDGHDDHDNNQNGEDENDNGDEGGDDYEDSEGLAYAFAPDRISLIDPEDGSIVDEISDGIDGYDWGDPRITTDLEEIFVIENSQNRVIVIDTVAREIVDEVGIGPDATHMYHPNDQEMWVHSDDEGAFYVVDVDTRDVTAIVESGEDGEGHGKLLYHEDLGSTGYATNVNDPGAPIIDLGAYERTDFVTLGEDDGTHYKAYGPQNGLAYFEFGDTTQIVDVETDDVVDELDFSGGMYLTPDEQLLSVIDGNDIHFVDVTDDENVVVGSVTVEGGPDALRYHEVDGTLFGFTANTTNDRAAVIDVDALEVVDELEIGYIEQPEDAHHLHRSGVAGDGYFFTPADEDGIVAVLDMESREVIDHVDVQEGVDTIQYVGDSGVGYTGRIR